jgi:hypothetical protein
MCVLKNIPIVDPRMAVCLASIMRDGIREIRHARATRAGRNEKAHQLYEYILARISDLKSG